MGKDTRNPGQPAVQVDAPSRPSKPQSPQQQIPAPPDAQLFQRPSAQSSQQPSTPAESRPLYREPDVPVPPAPSQQQATSRINVAPEAPASNTPRPANQVASPIPPTYQQSGDTGAFSQASQPLRRPVTTQPSGNGFDAITIMLAFLALIAVACLLPLYFLVFQAYFG